MDSVRRRHVPPASETYYLWAKCCFDSKMLCRYRSIRPDAVVLDLTDRKGNRRHRRHVPLFIYGPLKLL